MQELLFFMCDTLTPHNSEQIKSYTDHFNLIKKGTGYAT